MEIATPAVCFITFHGGPAEAFRCMIPELNEKEIATYVYAGGATRSRFEKFYELDNTDETIQKITQHVFETAEKHKKFTIIFDPNWAENLLQVTK